MRQYLRLSGMCIEHRRQLALREDRWLEFLDWMAEHSGSNRLVRRNAAKPVASAPRIRDRTPEALYAKAHAMIADARRKGG